MTKFLLIMTCYRDILQFICKSGVFAVSPLIKTARWSALFLGMFYGKQRFDYLKPIAEEERKVEEAEKAAREERERIYKQLSEANTDTILK
ncbi:mitochondrial ATP synthase subunit e [Scomber scombrus]|uniref:ATP synthase F(0) complex subunit e, mitochondrial n=1 Tax=Scomber scombrus TaxID=13677 RepID=A0AAV1NJM8_SCOSC